MDLREYIKENILVLDGGMGTLLQAEGLAQVRDLSVGASLTET